MDEINHKGEITIDFGRILANSTSTAQARVLNRFGRLLQMFTSGTLSFDMQCSYIVDDLDSYGKKLIEQIYLLMQSEKEND